MAKRTVLQIEPAVARGKLTEELWRSPEWAAEEKYDGDRRIAQFTDGGSITVVRFTGRRKSVKDGKFVEKTGNLPHLSNLTINSVPPDVAESLPNDARVRGLNGTVLDGEMIFVDELVEGGRSKLVTSIMGSLPAEAVQKQIERGWLRYIVFDCLVFRGEDIRRLPYSARRAAAQGAVKEWGNPYVEMSKAFGGRAKREFYEDVVAKGGEGVILKRVDAPYGDKQAWVKVKKTMTADVVVMGYNDAKETSKKKGEDKATITKYAAAGLIGAIRCGQYRSARARGDKGPMELVEVATVSGMDDTMRALLSMPAAQKRHLGSVLEIEHNGREPTGRFRHPRFNRWRPDKGQDACVMRKDET